MDMSSHHFLRQACVRFGLALGFLAALLTGPGSVTSAHGQSLDQEVTAALTRLYETTPAARDLAATAKGILVFPDISREIYSYTLGFQAGNGALIVGDKLVGYYATTSIAYGLQAGVLPFGYALFLMTDSALSRLDQSGGWQVGKDRGVVITRAGTGPTSGGNTDLQGGTMGVTGGTMASRPPGRTDTYAFVFGATDLLTGVGIEGWTITRIAGTAAAQSPGATANVGGLRVEFEAGQSKQGQPMVSGYVYNEGRSGVANVRLLVESMDVQGQVVGQAQGGAPGSLVPRARDYFEVPITTPGARYRVSVISWDTIDIGGP
jgi:lipid-binding SYLF domain-containing protein